MLCRSGQQITVAHFALVPVFVEEGAYLAFDLEEIVGEDHGGSWWDL